MLRGRRLSADSVAIGDVNGDGRPDLVTGGANKSATAIGVTVLLNRGEACVVANDVEVCLESGA